MSDGARNLPGAETGATADALSVGDATRDLPGVRLAWTDGRRGQRAIFVKESTLYQGHRVVRGMR